MRRKIDGDRPDPGLGTVTANANLLFLVGLIA